MQAINLAFVVIFSVLFVVGVTVFWDDMQARYPNAAAASPITSNITTNLTSSFNRLSNITVMATNQTQQFTSQDNPVAIAFGYLLGAFNGVKTLFAIPSIVGNVFSQLGQLMGAFYPSFLTPFITLATALVFLIGALYYWLKVK